MDTLIKQLTSPALLETYSKIWLSLKEIIGLLFNTKIVLFDTELTGQVTFSLGLLGLFLITYWTKGRTKSIVVKIIYFKVAFAVLLVIVKNAAPLIE